MPQEVPPGFEPDAPPGFEPDQQFETPAEARKRSQSMKSFAPRRPQAPLGAAPWRPLPEQHPAISPQLRYKLMYRSPTEEAAAENLRRLGFEAETRPGGMGWNISARLPGEKSWRQTEDPDLEWQDITDVFGELQDMVAGGGAAALAAPPVAAKGAAAGLFLGGPVGGTVGGVAGGIAGAAAGGAAGMAGSRALRSAGAVFDPEIDFQGMETLRGMKEAAIEGAVGEGGGKIIGEVVKPFTRLGAGIRARRAIQGEAGKLAAEQSDFALREAQALAPLEGREEVLKGVGRRLSAERSQLTAEGKALAEQAMDVGAQRRALQAQTSKELLEGTLGREAEAQAEVAARKLAADKRTKLDAAVRAIRAQEAASAGRATVEATEFGKEAARLKATAKTLKDEARVLPDEMADEKARLLAQAADFDDKAAKMVEKGRETRSRQGLYRQQIRERTAQEALEAAPAERPAIGDIPRSENVAPTPQGISRAEMERQAGATYRKTKQDVHELNQSAKANAHAANQLAASKIIDWDTARAIGDDAWNTAHQGSQEAWDEANRRVVRLFEKQGLGQDEAVRRAAEVRAMAEVQASVGIGKEEAKEAVASAARAGAPRASEILKRIRESPEMVAMEQASGKLTSAKRAIAAADTALSRREALLKRHQVEAGERTSIVRRGLEPESMQLKARGADIDAWRAIAGGAPEPERFPFLGYGMGYKLNRILGGANMARAVLAAARVQKPSAALLARLDTAPPAVRRLVEPMFGKGSRVMRKTEVAAKLALYPAAIQWIEENSPAEEEEPGQDRP